MSKIEITNEVAAYLRSAAAHPNGLTVIHDVDLRTQLFESSLFLAQGFGKVGITDKGRAALAAHGDDCTCGGVKGKYHVLGCPETAQGHAELVEALKPFADEADFIDQNLRIPETMSAKRLVEIIRENTLALQAKLDADATPLPEASDAPDIVPVAWVKPDWQNPANYDGMSPVTVYERRDWDPLIRLSDHTDALVALRAELAVVQRERDEWRESATEFRGLCSEWQTQADTAEAEVARLKDENKNSIRLTPAEIQSGHDRVKWAQGLIEQLSNNHDGRNSWLLNHGVGEEYDAKRKERGLCMDADTKSARRRLARQGATDEA